MTELHTFYLIYDTSSFILDSFIFALLPVCQQLSVSNFLKSSTHGTLGIFLQTLNWGHQKPGNQENQKIGNIWKLETIVFWKHLETEDTENWKLSILEILWTLGTLKTRNTGHWGHYWVPVHQLETELRNRTCVQNYTGTLGSRDTGKS